ncbi:hypothetical protein SAMN05421736_107113 [Evansella caseinilytica]|uniref:5-bromo-4-chloroindolyl phosphate hydrolysis protein n=1 Tax=Evansella caseinilytica TaxID=1503961 RepID=A0A1H3QZU5_9BACI|nr:hypothetical protein [Evansella caseinilytica]SDZ18611.1 hypothetical protein SAMN05421736_107113 [Evansella caseinilytica]
MKLLAIGFGITSLCMIALVIYFVIQHKKKKKQHYKDAFFKVYSPMIPKITYIKKMYGFFQKQLYLIKEHRTKQSSKIVDTLKLSEEIFFQVEANEQRFSNKVLEHFYSVKGMVTEQTEFLLSGELGSNDYFFNHAEYELNKSKILLTKAFMEEMTNVAKKADVLYTELEETLHFFDVFLEHILTTELIVPNQSSQLETKPKLMNRKK